MKLILASKSPRRATILRNAGIRFETCGAAEIDESPLPGETAEQTALRLAEAKARQGAARMSGPAIVIGADTIVVVDGETLGKPASAEDARRMLRRLAGRTHRVVTGVAAMRLPDGASLHGAEVTEVSFALLSDRDIDAYVATREPLGKAGAYAIQGRGGRFITRIAGCYFNVVGLPLARLCKMLRDLGWQQEPGTGTE
ncbi:MAG TPA: Maf family protein [Candidatus Acidoferrales bacterium]|nr:Maf family protein [Candidatus Acidoferrales bacterium]